MIISTIIPVYNASLFLEKCLNSLLNAQIEGLDNEIILVNDGSSDNSLEICDQYAGLHKNISVFSQENQGPSVARNLGIEKAAGEYITFVDSDDYVEENYFEIITKYFDSKWDILIFGYNKVLDKKIISNTLEGKTFDRKAIMNQISTSAQSMNLFWYPHTKVYKASVLSDLRFNHNINIGEDTIFNIEVMAHSKIIKTIKECLYNYVYNESSLTSVKYREDLLNNMIAHYKARIEIHHSFPELQTDVFYNDISKYYVNHILFWLIKNVKNSPADYNKLEELKQTRESIIYKQCFENYSYDWKHPMRSLIIKLFELRLLNSLLKVIK